MNSIRTALQTTARALMTCISLAVSAVWADAPATSENTDHQCGGEPCAAVFRGLISFFNRDLPGLDGNGRSCNDCHMVTEQFRLTPAVAEARFQKLLKRRQYNPNADDPLFRPIDADDFRTHGEQASDY